MADQELQSLTALTTPDAADICYIVDDPAGTPLARKVQVSTLIGYLVTTAGDILYATAARTLARLGIGTALQVLQTNSGATAPQWAASPQSVLTATGDILYASGANTLARLAVGTAGQVLATNSGATAPVWANAQAADGWTPDTATWTYASATTFTVATDVTAQFRAGTKLKLTQTTAKYFYVTASSYGAPNTTVTVTGGTDYTLANAAITSPYYSYAAAPQAFPDWFDYTTVVTPGTGAITAYTETARFSICGRTLHFKVSIVITNNGTGATDVRFTLPVTAITTAGGYLASGRENISAGKSLMIILSGGKGIAYNTTDSSYPGGTNNQLDILGLYEI